MPTEYDPASENEADIVIADLPCSGLGIIGRKPDIKYHATEENLKELAKLQKRDPFCCMAIRKARRPS